MITIPFSKSKLTILETSDWRGVQKLINKPNSIMIYEHEPQAKALIALGDYLNNIGLGIMRMHVYHNCQEYPVKIQVLNEGFPIGECPMCKKTFLEDEVKYDLELIVKYKIKLEN